MSLNDHNDHICIFVQAKLHVSPHELNAKMSLNDHNDDICIFVQAKLHVSPHELNGEGVTMSFIMKSSLLLVFHGQPFFSNVAKSSIICKILNSVVNCCLAEMQFYTNFTLIVSFV